MVSESSFSPWGKAYLWLVIFAGLMAVGWSIYQLLLEPIGYPWFILAALTLASGSATVKLPSSYASISISETFVFTAVLLYGPAAGTIIVALDGLVISFWISKRHDEPHRALFNMSAPAVSAWCSSHLFFYVSHVAPLALATERTSVYAILPALILFALTYFSLNSWLIAFVIALERRVDPIKVWTSTFVWLSLNYFGGASVAILFVGFSGTLDLTYREMTVRLGMIVPLLLVLYFTFKTSMGRVEDADRHLEELNELYLSTIETLAMAIDAKDQVTHGHIRRVQSYATSLAREVGVKDEALLKAIEAAALLHDMGKLAVPEYILNKPGKLTETEFDKIKLHASVGADILSAIAFPYPVVPIVRHHHENWNGSGYPESLKGTEIPIGARILSVVDCFDALTSDRPYRPRLGDAEALRILVARRGIMYDPLVVDAFLRVHRAIAPGTIESGPPENFLNDISGARMVAATQVPPPVLEEIAASADEMLTLYDLASGLAGQITPKDASDVIARHLRRLIPASLCVFYLYDSVRDEIEASHAVGEGSSFVRGVRIPMGQRLSGWVAANRQTILNSDPTLDLGDAARGHAQRLRSCMSTPLVVGDALVGVLSLYSEEPNGFNDDHRRVVEVIARQVAHTFQRAFETDNRPRDGQTGLPHVSQLEQIVKRRQAGEESPRYALLSIEIRGLEHVRSRFGRQAGDEVIRHVAHHARLGLRITDSLFRNADDDLVAFLNATDAEAAEAVAAQVRNSIRRHPPEPSGDRTTSAEVRVTVVSSPNDGSTLSELLKAARNRAQSLTADRDGSTVH